MASISSLGYFVIGATDLAACEAFAVDAIGLQTGMGHAKDSLTLRMDDHAQRVLIQKSEHDDLLAVGWQLDTEQALDEFVSDLKRKQVQVQMGSPELIAERRVKLLYHCDCPNGIRHEFYAGALRASTLDAFRSKVMKAGFLTGRLGVGHFVIAARDAGEATDFCTQVLGIRISDYIRGEVAPGKVLDATFYHTSTGRHHSIATAMVPFPLGKRIHHIMFEMVDMDDVGMAFDRCIKLGYEITSGLGHHPNDKMFSFYVRTPSGFLLEVGTGGVVVDDDNWEIKSFSQLSDWGHHKSQPKPATT
ncbi:MAG: VOC family protein [Betaproteobacteria bacterium]|nr:VOC family protein [Betaproteobacteria bacterium]